jgi:uncharacterized protein (DUF488 family)
MFNTKIKNKTKINIKTFSDIELGYIVSNNKELRSLINDYNALLIEINKIYIYNNMQLIELVKTLSKHWGIK